MIWSDLLNAPYKSGGRSIFEGFDCYGLVLECCRRNGTPLTDFSEEYRGDSITPEELARFRSGANVRRIGGIRAGAVVECEYNGHSHLGFAVDGDNILHTTKDGVRCTYRDAVSIKAVYEVLA